MSSLLIHFLRLHIGLLITTVEKQVGSCSQIQQTVYTTKKVFNPLFKLQIYMKMR